MVPLNGAVDSFSMSHLNDQHHQLVFHDVIDDSVFSLPNSKVISASQFFTACRPRIFA